MKKLYLKLFIAILSIIFFPGSIVAQTIVVDGQCIDGPLTLIRVDDVEGKPAYEGTGTIQGIENTQISIYWIGGTDNVWVIAFDGQPYFLSACLTDIPPGTANPTCLWEAVEDMTCTGGRPFSVTGAVVLPVSIISFSAGKSDGNVILTWQTPGESSSKGFAIQKSADGVTWVNIGFVNSRTSSQAVIYHFTDAAPYEGRNAYRLQQADLSGTLSYSVIANVDFKGNPFYTLSDNPGRGLFRISMRSSLKKLHLNVVDASGKVIYRKAANAGDQLLDLSEFPAGMYWLHLKIGDNQFTEKIIKLN